MRRVFNLSKLFRASCVGWPHWLLAVIAPLWLANDSPRWVILWLGFIFTVGPSVVIDQPRNVQFVSIISCVILGVTLSVIFVYCVLKLRRNSRRYSGSRSNGVVRQNSHCSQPTSQISFNRSFMDRNKSDTYNNLLLNGKKGKYWILQNRVAGG